MEEPTSEERHRELTPRNRDLKAAVWVLAIGGLIVMILYLFKVTPADVAHTVTRCLSCH